MQIYTIPTPEFDAVTIAKKVHAEVKTVERLVDSVTDAMDIKAGFRVCSVTDKNQDAVTIDGVHFTSRVLHHHLAVISRVFPFVLTLGPGLDTVIDRSQDFLEKYLLDEIGNVALRESRGLFEHYIRKTYEMDTISCMSPGSLKDWPIEEQKELFSLLNGVESTIGVRLTDSLLMIPRKSISGIYFPSRHSFNSCQLCPRERCDNRKASYDEDKARELGILQ